MKDCENILGCQWLREDQKLTLSRTFGKRLKKRVLGWKEKYILKAGREVLIKIVAQAIPTYSMIIFKIPATLCNTINSSMAKYQCVQTKAEKKIHQNNWKKLCTPNDRGEMGFKDIQAFNLALLAKQAWRLIHNNHSLFYCVYKLRHFPHCSFMDAEVGSNPSYVWRSLLAARDVIFEGSKWEVGDGSRIEVSTHK